MLMYGSEYRSAVPVFEVMVVVAGITLSQGAFGALLSTTDRQRIRAFVAALSVGLSALFAILLVPRFGLHGAVLAHAASSGLIFLVIGVGVVKTFSLSLPWPELSRLFAAAALAAGAAGTLKWLGSSLWLEFVAGIAYGVVFIAGTFVFKAWTPSDLSSMKPLGQRIRKLVVRVFPSLSDSNRR